MTGAEEAVSRVKSSARKPDDVQVESVADGILLRIRQRHPFYRPDARAETVLSYEDCIWLYQALHKRLLRITESGWGPNVPAAMSLIDRVINANKEENLTSQTLGLLLRARHFLEHGVDKEPPREDGP